MNTNENLTALKYYALMLYAPFLAIANYTGLDAIAIECLTILVLIDIVTGISKTICIGKKPTSTRLANGIFSKLILLLIPVCVAIAVKGLGLDFSSLIDTTLIVLILSELYSIIANIYTIRTKKQVEEFDAISIILRVIRTKVNRFLGDK